MKVLPFVLKEIQGRKLKTYRLSVFFANGGHSLWEVDHENDLEMNEIYTVKIIKEKNIYFCQVDPTRTRLEEFYSWEEIQEDPKKKSLECWRDYYFFFDSSGGEWWSPKGIHEASIPELGNIGETFEVILRHNT